MKKSVFQSELMLNMNERLFLNALEGITDAQANQCWVMFTRTLHLKNLKFITRKHTT
jgi:hypothetical protein